MHDSLRPAGCATLAVFAAVLCWVLAAAKPAYAQGCCASGASLTPVRLDLHERALFGAQLGANVQYGSFDDASRYRGAPDGTSDVEFRQTAFGTFAPWSRLQLSALVPFLETRRVAPGAAPEWGGGLGDVSVLARIEPITLREYPGVPAIAVLGSLVTPTGTAPEQASQLLGSDATGAGVWRVGGGLAVEQAYSAFLLNVTAMLSNALPRTTGETRFVYAPRWDVALGVGYAVSHYWHVAGVLNYEHEAAPKVNGATGQPRRRLDTAVLLTHLLDDGLRVQAGVTFNPPLPEVGRNEQARVGVTGSLVRSWF